MKIAVVDNNIGLVYDAANHMVRIGRIRHGEEEDFLHDLYIELRECIDEYNPKYALSTWVRMVSRRVQQRIRNSKGARINPNGGRMPAEVNFDRDTTKVWESFSSTDANREEYETREEALVHYTGLMEFMAQIQTRRYTTQQLQSYMQVFIDGNCKQKALIESYGLGQTAARNLAEYLRQILVRYRNRVDD